MRSQSAKAAVFRALHERKGAFIIANPWDAGSARILDALGFEALATTSAGLAFALGIQDGSASRAQTLANAKAIVEATDLPVSADLENGFGHRPETVAETIAMASAAALVGGSIEDATGEADAPIYAFDHAVARVAAAAKAARALPIDFVLTARAENFIHGRADLDDTIARLIAFERAGADVLYAPGLPSLEAVRKVCRALAQPVNFVAGWGGEAISAARLASAGVRRISLGSSLARAALGGLVEAAREIKDQGTFGFAARALPYAQTNAFMRPATRRRRGFP
jgi:2-methylisocitrate lyase-like PEP mutase family enzyme